MTHQPETGIKQRKRQAKATQKSLQKQYFQRRKTEATAGNKILTKDKKVLKQRLREDKKQYSIRY